LLLVWTPSEQVEEVVEEDHQTFFVINFETFFLVELVEMADVRIRWTAIAAKTAVDCKAPVR
jgi:hypothetical protein